MRCARPSAILMALALLACAGARALAQAPAPAADAPATTPPVAGAPPGPPPAMLALGALLPLAGPGAWFAEEIRFGIELAVAELAPKPRRPAAPTATTPPAEASGDAAGHTAAPAAAAPTTEGGTAAAPETAPPGSGDAGGAASPPRAPAAPPPEPIEPLDRPQTVRLGLTARGVQPADVRAATAEFQQLAGTGVVAIFTASPTPTLAIHPLATAHDVLVLHAGLPTDRFPGQSRTLLQLRPSIAARGEALAAHAWARGVRRLAVLAAGDEFGRALRTAIGVRWRQQGAALVHDENLLLEAPDARARLRALLRTAPDAVALAYWGPALGEAATLLRGAGYAGLVLGADDDRAALLAAGPALDDALLLSDAFIPEPGTRGARFARAYEAKHKRAPSRFAASAYEGAMLLASAATANLTEGRGLTGRRLREALAPPHRFPSLYAGDLTVREDGSVVRPFALFRVEEGRLAPVGYVGPDGQLLGPPRARGGEARRLARSP